MIPPTREEIVRELKEKQRDLEVFTAARELIRSRVLELVDSSCSLTPLPVWSGTDAVLGSLDLSIHSIERTVEELKQMLRQLGDSPTLRVVKTYDN